MTFGPDAVAVGHADENATMDALAALGWGCTLFGQRLWDPTTCPAFGDPIVMDVIHKTTRWPIRWAPDVLACHPARGPVLVEVTRNDRGTGRRAVEVSKLVSDDAWSAVAPVVFVDVHDWTAWRHVPVRWAALAVSDVTRYTNNGSGDPYALFHTTDQRPFVDVFA